MSKDNLYDLETLSVADYSALEDKSIVDVILSNLNASDTLKTRLCDIKPRKPSLAEFTLREVIYFKNKFQAGEVEEVLHHVYGIKTIETANVYSVTAVLKWLEAEMVKIYKNEERLSSKKDSDTWRQAGIERLEGFGHYCSLFMLTQDITKENEILDMPYYRIFDYSEIKKVWSEIESKFTKIKQEQQS
jgi:hypothetical protein